jgi:hypothetical protein
LPTAASAHRGRSSRLTRRPVNPSDVGRPRVNLVFMQCHVLTDEADLDYGALVDAARSRGEQR